MKAIMLVSPKTYARLKGKFAFIYEADGESAMIDLEPIIDAADGVGYLLVDGQYQGKYNVEGKAVNTWKLQ